MSDPVTFLDGRVELRPGDCLDVIRAMPDASVHAVVSDPPYALVSIARRFGGAGAAPARVPEGGSGVYARASAGFMGKSWDTGERAFAVEFWAEVWRVLKPGGHVLAFAGTRTYHRLVCAIEDAGFEIRDQIGWAYGTGFNKKGYIFRDADGRPTGPWGGALKPAWEPIVVARKALIGTVAENVIAHGTGALNIDGCRVKAEVSTARIGVGPKTRDTFGSYGDQGGIVSGGSALGRWPANILHDGSDEVIAAFPDAPGQQRATGPEFVSQRSVYGAFTEVTASTPRLDSGSAARFFYSAKADADDRLGSKHPTVKPVDLIRWLVRLVTPPGGIVLDPFAGTGTTGEAAFREGSRAILIEREAEYQTDIARRMGLVLAGPGERRAARAKPTGDHGPLFGVVS